MNAADNLFDWMEQTDEGRQFMSDCFGGTNSINKIRDVAMRFGIPLRTLWNLCSGIGLRMWRERMVFYTRRAKEDQ